MIGTPPYRHVRASDLPWIGNVGMELQLVRRHLGVTAFAINTFRAADVGGPVIERHDESSPNAGAHEELYIVTTGAARFTIAGEEIEAGTGDFVLVPVGVEREAVATVPGTTVLVIGGKPDAAMPPSPFEAWYAAAPAYESGDYLEAIRIASPALADWPRNGGLNYQLACYHALAGHRDEAIAHLLIAFANDPRTRAWAAQDVDLESVRDDPALG